VPISGGPQRPDVSALSDNEKQEVLKQYKKARRKYTDECKKNINTNNNVTVDLDWSQFTGNCSECLRPMIAVEE
jgi:hypothetical protein